MLKGGIRGRKYKLSTIECSDGEIMASTLRHAHYMTMQKLEYWNLEKGIMECLLRGAKEYS